MTTLFFKKIYHSLFDGFSLWAKAKNHSVLMKMLKDRMIFFCICCVLIVLSVAYKLFDIMILQDSIEKVLCEPVYEQTMNKADITDRNGCILATSIKTASCYADAAVVIDVDETAKKLSSISGMPSFQKIKQKLKDKNKHFVWIERHITPVFQQQIMNLGLPGIFFQKDYKRMYPYGSLFSHIVGYCDIDGKGVFGIEKKFNEQLLDDQKSQKSQKNLRLTMDLKLQFIVHEEMQDAVKKFHAVGGNAILMKVKTGEILSMVSLPDFDPCAEKQPHSDAMFNKNTLGVYEAGSTFKILNIAIGLDSGLVKIHSMFDATTPIKVGKFSITDFRGKNRALSLAEAFVFSSNIASVRIQQAFGHKMQKEYMKKLGVFDKGAIELPEIAPPILPKQWTEASAMTIAYGYGVAISPVQQISIVASILNFGRKIEPTLLFDREPVAFEQLISEKTSEQIRELMRAVMLMGTGRNANVSGMGLFGKTGTAYKTSGLGYGSSGKRERRTTFLGGFPYDDPEYILLIMLDDPKAIEGTYGYATAGYNAAPTAKNIFQRIAPILMKNGNREDEKDELKVARYIQTK